MEEPSYARNADGVGRRASLRQALGAIAGIAILGALAAGVEWSELVAAVRHVSAPWLAAAAISVVATLWLVVARWGLLVGPGASTRPWRIWWDAVVVGQALNVLLPLRFGEGARLAMTSRTAALPAARVAVGLAVERALDLAAFTVALAVVAAGGWLPATFSPAAPAVIGLSLLVLAATVGLLLLSPQSLEWVEQLLQGWPRVAAWMAAQRIAVRSCWEDGAARRTLIPAAVLTALILAVSTATNLLVLLAFAIPVPLLVALVLRVVLQAGTTIVSVPGNLGVHHSLTVATLAVWDVPRAQALVVAIVLHALTQGCKVLLALTVVFPGGHRAAAAVPCGRP